MKREEIVQFQRLFLRKAEVNRDISKFESPIKFKILNEMKVKIQRKEIELLGPDKCVNDIWILDFLIEWGIYSVMILEIELKNMNSQKLKYRLINHK